MGFGRIGRNIFRQAYKDEDIDIVAVSDLGTPESMAYLLEFDTIYGRFPDEVKLDGKYLCSGRQRTRLLRGTRPDEMTWEAYDTDVVIEATGVYRHRADLQGHLDSGAKRVILTTPAIDDIDRTIVHGINADNLSPEDRLISCASTTTHVLALMIKVLDDAVGIEHAMMTTVHAYSSDQKLADAATPDLRRSRSGAENLIPNSNWSPAIVSKMMPHLEGKLGGVAINVPVPNGSNLDLSARVKQPVTKDDVNEWFQVAANGNLKGYVEYADEPIVSSDVIENPHSAVYDSLATIVLPGGLVKAVCWYDNGWGYAGRILETVRTLGGFLHGGAS